MDSTIIVYIILALLCLIVLYDLFQKEHAILRNFPLIGHLRYLGEIIGPEIRQYWVIRLKTSKITKKIAEKAMIFD